MLRCKRASILLSVKDIMCVSLIGRTACYGHVNISSNLIHTLKIKYKVFALYTLYLISRVDASY